MAVKINAMPVSFVAHAFAIIAAIMVLVWNISFRGGIAWESSDKNFIMNLHIVVMLIGFVIVGGEAIMSHKSLPLEKHAKKLVHFGLHSIALALGIWGICAAFKNHNESGKPNLYSLHSWIGIGVISLYGLQWLYTLGLFFYPRGSLNLRSDELPWNETLGLFVFTLTVGNAVLGYLEKLTFLETLGLDKFGTEAYFVHFLAMVTILFGAFVVLTVSANSPSPSLIEDDDFNYNNYSAI